VAISTDAPLLPDRVPAGVSIPAGAGTQAFEFGHCQTRAHAAGGWVCMDTLPDAASARASRRHHRTVRAHAASYYRYHFTAHELAAWGVGSVQYGTINWNQNGNFNGSQHQVAQDGAVWEGAHTVRYDFRIDAWRATSVGWQFREEFQAIRPAAPSCSRSTVVQPTWNHAQTAGYDYYMSIFFHMRDCAVNNPSTPDGTFYSPIYATKTYHCIDSTGNCYFKGY
jgi:hypothetical protein